MALLPVHAFPGALFLEARMLGQPAEIVSQIGLSIDAPECSVALFCDRLVEWILQGFSGIGFFNIYKANRVKSVTVNKYGATGHSY
ncbi:hypothetical protein RB195_015579 [Necator americanus]|uniref:Uncharacterized protein n=1 Tax=Necator americanus TaxID=51031 RepID=A0ABR1E758_NECAM